MLKEGNTTLFTVTGILNRRPNNYNKHAEIRQKKMEEENEGVKFHIDRLLRKLI